MLYRPLDPGGDMLTVTRKDQIWNSAKAVAAAIESRLHFYAGEWWEDEALGFGLMALLAEGSPGGNREDAIGRLITRHIQETENVARVADVRVAYDRASRSVHYSCRAITKGKENIEVEVTGDGVSATVLG